jgi:glycosyltransferase involved in cell wall biosynthesis
VLDVARGQIARGHEVGIFCDSTTGGQRTDEILAELAPQLRLGLHRVQMRRLPHWTDVSALVALTRLYRTAKPHVLHAHGSKGGLYARTVTAPSQDRRTVRAYTPHGGSFNYKPGSAMHRAYMWAEKLLERRTDIFLFESEYIKGRFDAYVGEPRRLARVIRNGIAKSEFDPLDRVHDPYDLLYLGELREAKGVDTLVEAVAKIRREHGLRLTLLAVGSGPSEAELHKRTEELGIWDSTTFAPPQPIRAALARGRIMVIPSKAESLPYVILEAAAAAQPLVSTNVGGIPEIFGEYSDQLIPPSDVDALAAAILAKVAEPESVRRAKAEALSRNVREGFDIDTMVEHGLQGYRDAMAARGINPA